MDKFVVKMPNTSSQEKKKRSHLPVNISAKDRARKYPEGTFHDDDGLQRSGFHLRKFVVDKHLEAESHKPNVEKMQVGINKR